MHRYIDFGIILCAACLTTVPAAFAAPVTVPTGLQPGDQYRLVFVTSTTHNALSTNIADYNAVVSGVAASVPELAALGTTWKAIGSTAATNAHDNTGTNPFVSTGVPFYRLDDTRVADDNQDLWSVSGIDANVSTNENGVVVASDVWSGTNLDGTTDQLSPLGGAITIYGTTYNAPEFWLYAGGASSPDTLHALYAMSDVLTVVPEPGTTALACIGAIAVLGGQLFRRRRKKF